MRSDNNYLESKLSILTSDRRAEDGSGELLKLSVVKHYSQAHSSNSSPNPVQLNEALVGNADILQSHTKPNSPIHSPFLLSPISSHFQPTIFSMGSSAQSQYANPYRVSEGDPDPRSKQAQNLSHLIY